MIIKEMAFMKKRTTIAVLLAAALLSGCASSTDGETTPNNSGDNAGATTHFSTSDTTTSSADAPEESMNDWWFTIEDGVLTEVSTSASGKVVIPDSVTRIANNAFRKNDDITEIVVPSSVKVIEGYSIKDLKNLQKLTLSEGLEKIFATPICGCDELRELELPQSIEYVSPDVFYNHRLSIIYNGKTYTSHDTNELCKAVCFDEDGLYIKDGVLIEILDREQGDELVIPATVTEIGPGAFLDRYCTKVTVPSTVTKIEESAFYAVAYIGELVFEEGITTLPDNLFTSASVGRMVLPSTLTDIKEYSLGSNSDTVFVYNGKEYCRNVYLSYHEDDWCKLFTMLMPQYNEDGLLIEDNVLVDALFCIDRLDRELVIPEGVTVIGEAAFIDSCYSYYIKLPQSLTEIKDKAFLFTFIKEIEIPENVKSIGAGAFSGCSSLTRVVLPDGLEYLGEDAFKMCNKAVIEYRGEQYTPDDIMALFAQ